MRHQRLSEWLAWQETLHPWSVDLGLERCGEVARRLGVDATDAVVFTVAGTNGKGSCAIFLESCLRAAGLATGTYLSPHLLRYNERVRIDGAEVGDVDLMRAFEAVESARGAVPLTAFEFGTLAALHALGEAALDAAVLEVGLGGRLDAVNVLDPDVAIVTGVALDHAAWLGDDRESIGREKAGIFRAGRPAVYGEADPPASVVATAAALGAPLHRLGGEYRLSEGREDWAFEHGGRRLEGLPRPRLPGAFQLRNAAAALAALALSPVAVGDEALRRGLAAASPLPGRLEVVARAPEVLVDVAHNPAAAAALAAHLGPRGAARRTIAVAAMLDDKDVEGTAGALAGSVDRWHAASLGGPRGGDGARIAAALAPAARVSVHRDVDAAWSAARAEAGRDDRIVAFGSFLTAARVTRLATAAACLETR